MRTVILGLAVLALTFVIGLEVFKNSASAYAPLFEPQLVEPQIVDKSRKSDQSPRAGSPAWWNPEDIWENGNHVRNVG